MSALQSLHRPLFTLLLAACSALVLAAEPCAPQIGQEGKDVIWVPTPNELIAKMLDMAKLTAKDIHFDLGSGDGRTVIAAAKRGATATGVEFNPDMVALSNRSAKREGVADKAKFINGDIFQTDFSKATVITLYLLPSLNLKLRPLILAMAPGTRVVSHNFGFGDWKPDHGDASDDAYGWLWIVPAAAAGRWQVELPAQSGIDARRFEFQLRQRFQQVQGEARINDAQAVPLFSSELRGDQLSLSVMDSAARWIDFKGRLSGNRFEGGYRDASGAQGSFVARRVAE